MEKEFVPYDRALRLKALGYNKPSLGYFDDTGWLEIKVVRSSIFVEKVDDYCLAPTFSQAFRWFREKYRRPHIWIMDELLDTGEYSYEEAELSCLDRLIEIVELNQNKDE